MRRGLGRGQSAPPQGGTNSASKKNLIPYTDYAELIKRFLELYNPSGGARRDQRDEQDASEMDVDDDLPLYMGLLRQVARRTRVRYPVAVDHLAEFFAGDVQGAKLVEALQMNCMRFVELFSEVIDVLLKQRFGNDVVYDTRDVFDVYLMHRSTSVAAAPAAVEDNVAEGAKASIYPPALLRRYELYFIPPRQEEALALRKIRAEHIGHLIRTRGIVIRASELMPQVTVAVYLCGVCGSEAYQEVLNKTFMPLVKCESQKCKEKKQRAGTLHMQTRGSRFVKFQEIRIQELPEEVPVGHVPRSIVCHVRGEITRRVGPGDVVKLDGVFLPVPFGGYQQVFAGLITDTYLHAMRLKRSMKSYSEYKLTPVMLDHVEKAASSPDAYTRLAMSIAPEIFGHLDVKKALLLMMVGGVTRRLPDGMNIRGDINICLMGDPGVAKSQLLKHIAHSAPRGIYTSGKGSSGVGLTAAVLKDPVSGEFVLEGGSLVLADMGICCIDEFDKMADADRTSIHEVMEQQSISIAKAGITCSLNARTAILAAANPAYGRYNTARTPAENINLPAALLSRFDLLFLLLDKPNWEHDMALGKHIAHVHTHSAAPELEFEPLSSDFLRSYVSRAKSFEPFVPESISDHIVSAYVGMREAEMKDQANAKSYTTARTLLAILRLSQALAKLRFAAFVTVADVDEAIRLMNSSKISLLDQGSSKQQAVDTMSSIYDIIRRYAEDLKQDNVPYDEILRRVLRKGYRQDDLNKTLHEYEQLNVWMVSADKSTIVFL